MASATSRRSSFASGLSAARVATKLGCAPDSVLTYARAAGVPIRPRLSGRKTPSN